MKLPIRPEAKPSGTSGATKIHGFQGTDFVFAAEQPHGDDDAQEAAVERHAAFPDFDHVKRMFEVV